MTSRARFKQADLVRAANALKAVGLRIARLEIEPNGTIVIIPGLPQKAGGNSDAWDERIKGVRAQRMTGPNSKG